MFHILPKDVTVLKQWPESQATKVLCDVKTPREAIPLKRFFALTEQGKLRKERCCKVCYRKATSGFSRT
jgi:hypothetical protein